MNRDLTTFIRSLKSRPAKWIVLMLFSGGEVSKYNEPVRGRTRLTKEIFLFQSMEPSVDVKYDFKPYDYGPFAQPLLSDLEELLASGLVQADDSQARGLYSLTPGGVELAKSLWDSEPEKIRRRIFDVKVRFNRMPLAALLSYVYDRYPRFAEKSVYEPPEE